MRHLSHQALLLIAAIALVGGIGCSKKADGGGTPTPAVEAQSGSIAITVGEEGFKPNKVKLKKGAPAALVFTRTTDETCATEVVFPQLDIKKELPKGQAVSITIPTDKEQNLTFQCGMGMYKSSVVIATGN